MLYDTLKTLCCLSGVSGCEDEVRDYILERVMPYADRLHTDSMGNILVFKRGKITPAHSVMLCAHMDEVGVIITGITDDGYLRFDFVGGVDRRVVIGKKVFVGADRVCGVIGIRAYHLVSKDEEKDVPKTEALYIDIGADDKASAQNLVTPGDFGVFDDSVLEFGEGYIKAKAIDDRVGCAVMLELVESDLPVDTWFAFTVQEEVGARGAHSAVFAIRPDIALLLEGTTAADLPEVPEAQKICTLGDGVVIAFMDKSAIYNPDLRNTLMSLSDKNGIKWQTKQVIAGGTDASAIQRSHAGVRTAVLAVGVRNIHSPSSVARLSDIDEMAKLAKLFLENIDGE